MIYITGDVHGGVDVRKLLDKDWTGLMTRNTQHCLLMEIMNVFQD